MHNILSLKGQFHSRKNPAGGGGGNLPVGGYVTSEKIERLVYQLKGVLDYWEKDKLIGGALVSVHYTRVVAKSNRLKVLLSINGVDSSDFVRGAKFDYDKIDNRTKHIFTYYVSLNAIESTIDLLKKSRKIIDEEFKGKITHDNIVSIAKRGLKSNDIVKTRFVRAIVDSYYVDYFSIDRNDETFTDDSIVTIYKTDIDTRKLLNKLGVNIYDDRIINETTLNLKKDEIAKLQEKAGYLIAMSVTDFTQIASTTIDNPSEGTEDILIPPPNNEPIVGVIDTLFDEKVYFHEWVEYTCMLDESIPIRTIDYKHGTSVSSIIVDGPKGNPAWDDGCGRFRVRHFGVATQAGFSSFAVLKAIRKIVAENPDIKVWNLSLGSKKEIPPNFISPEAAELDRLQNEYDVIFVVAGTNRPEGVTLEEMKIGSPADSLNSLVVNAVNIHGQPASYTRVGPVLSFFNKPDIAYFGGDGCRASEQVRVCYDDLGGGYDIGTSFSAPWITRKVAYLIYICGFSREVAKALLIDVAAGWQGGSVISNKLGYGIVPTRISDIIHTNDDEIRFVITGNTDEYETYTYNLPIPRKDDKFPFYARATLAYFPYCDRNQGVDYTSTEMDIHFGRVYERDGQAGIKDIKNNRQDETGVKLYEEDARKLFRKWDNIKHISEKITENPRPRKSYPYGAGNYGISIKTKERSKNRNGMGLQFGVVITLKEMFKQDRYDDFIKLCMSRGWLVNQIDIDQALEIFNKQEEIINLD